MFRRSLIGVLDPFPPFPSTPSPTQPSLQTGIGFTCADPRDGWPFGRMAEQSTLTLAALMTQRHAPFSRTWLHAHGDGGGHHLLEVNFFFSEGVSSSSEASTL